MAATVVYLPWKQSSIDGHTKPIWYNELTPSDPDSLAVSFFPPLDAWVTAVGGTKIADISATTSQYERGCVYELPDRWSPSGKIVFQIYGYGSTGPGQYDTNTTFRLYAGFETNYNPSGGNGLGSFTGTFINHNNSMGWSYPTYKNASNICYSTEYPGKEWFMFNYAGLNSGTSGQEYQVRIFRNSLYDDLDPAVVTDWKSRTTYPHSEWTFNTDQQHIAWNDWRILCDNQTLENWPGSSPTYKTGSVITLNLEYALELGLRQYDSYVGTAYTIGDNNFGYGLDDLKGTYSTFKPDIAGTEKWMLPVYERLWVKVED